WAGVKKWDALFDLYAVMGQTSHLDFGPVTKPLDEDDDIVVLENSESKEEDVKKDESDHSKERYTFDDDDDDGEFDDLD
ncbi:hypothetical protein Tco_1470297, partial [Tanacetum coccineum]